MVYDVIGLLGLAKDIFAGKKSTSKMTIPQIEAAIADLGRERQKALDAKSKIFEKRSAAVLAGADYDSIAAIEREEGELDLKLERLEIAEPALLQKLRDAQTVARRAEWDRRRSQLKDRISAYIAAARAAEILGREALNLRDEISGFFAEMMLLSPIPALPGGALVLDQATLARFEEECERFFSAPPVLRSENVSVNAPAYGQTSTIDYSGVVKFAPSAPVNESRSQPKIIAGDDTFRTVAVGDRTPPATGDGLLIVRPMVDSIALKTGEDGLVAIDFLRRYDAGGFKIEPGRHHVTPGVALAALRAGMADLPDETAGDLS